MTANRKRHARSWLLDDEAVSGVLAWDRPVDPDPDRPLEAADATARLLAGTPDRFDSDMPWAEVMANPSEAGFTLTHGQLAQAVGLAPSDVMLLSQAFQLDDDTSFAVKVPQGKRSVVWFRSEAASRLLELIADPPDPLSDLAHVAVLRSRKTLKGG